jgi:hypothetical protein
MACPLKIGDQYEGGVVTDIYRLKDTWRAKVEYAGRDDQLLITRDLLVIPHKIKLPVPEPLSGRGRKASR